MANYLYNGIELPPLPVRDETVLPFAAIGKPGFVEPPEGEKYLFFCSEQINYTTIVGALLPTKGKGYVYKYTKGAGTWEKYDDWGFPDSTFPTSECSITRVDWSNYNILNTDGTLYLAASEPIPVGTAPALDPLSLLMGWKAGNWVARQRGKKVEEEDTDSGLGDTYPITFSVPDVLENTSFAYDDAELCYYKISNMIPTADELSAVTIAVTITAGEGEVFAYDEIYIWSSTNDVGHLVANFGSVDYGFLEYYLVIPKNSDGYEPGFYILNDGKGIWTFEDATIQLTMSKSE